MDEPLISRLIAAGHDERLATGALYLEAAESLAAERAVSDVLGLALRWIADYAPTPTDAAKVRAALAAYDASRGAK